ncbi:MAG: hypothetical protein WCJ26_12840 [bacterium]
MNKRNKRLLIYSLLLLFAIVILALGLKHFPFTKLVKMPAGSEKEFVNPEKIPTLAPHTLYYDFEVAPGKELPGGFYKGIAHSGEYSVKAFGQNSFSVAVERTAGEIGVENLKAVAISAWIYVFPTKKDVKGSLVFTASNEVGVNVCWQGIGIVEPEVPRGKWFKISKYFDLTSVPFKPGYKLQVYFWNNSGTDILVDDYFIAFGGAIDRRGDSARVDMTKPAGFVPKFNYPPFPVSLLEKETIAGGIDPAEIGRDDLVVSGDFFNNGNPGLIVVHKDGKPSAYAYSGETSGFRKVVLDNPAAFAAVGTVKNMLKGKFLPGMLRDQLLIEGDKGWLIAEVISIENIIKTSDAPGAGVRILWKSGDPAASIHAGDFNGDRRSEVLMISRNGTWKVMAFQQAGKTGGTWKVLNRDEVNPVKQWDRATQEVGISVGRFLPGLAQEVVLTVTRNLADGKYAYSLSRLNLAGKGWEPLFTTKPDHSGRTIGLDTLKPSDLIFTASGKGNKVNVYRYNRDWRYDLKEIRFNDSTFSIVSAVDFHGYDRDQNPKYYESLKLVPGCCLVPGITSIMAIGHVSKTRKYQDILPDFVHFYALPENK